jgi:hypothetical protein
MTIDLSWLTIPICLGICLPVYVAIVAILMTLSMRSRIKYAKRIQDALARSAFDDLSSPEQSPRNLWLAFTALVGLLGVVVTFGVLILQVLGIVVLRIEVILITFGIFGSLSTMAGILMQRRINRRL